MKPTFTIRKNFHYQNFLILCLLLASTVTGFSKEVIDLRYNSYLRSEAVKQSYLERYKQGIRTLYSFEKIIAGYRTVKDDAVTAVYAKGVAGTTDEPCYSEIFKYCAGEEIKIEIEAEAGYQNYKWFRDNVEIEGATGSVYIVTAPGSYHFTAEDPESCEARLCCPYLVTQETGFDAVIIKTDAACAAGTAGSITVTPDLGEVTDYTYSLDGGPFQASNSFTGLAGGSYIVTIKNENGCEIEKTVEISQPGGITAKVESACDENLTTATIVASGGVRPYTYSLDGGAFGSDSVFAALSEGQHEVVIKDANGCTYKVIVDAYCECTPEIYEYCPGEVIEILAEALPGQGNYQWYKNGEAIEGAIDSVYTITAIGNYHYTSGGDDTCEGELCCPIIVREKEAPAVYLSGGELSCNTTSIQLNTGSDPANTFSWSGPNGFTGSTPAVTVTEPGTYIVTVTGANGCATLDTAVVTLDGQLPTVTVAGGELTCDVTSLEITANGSAGVTYSWSGPGGFTATTESITATAAGDYIVTVTGTNGCIAKDTATVIQNTQLPTVTVTGGELTCNVTSLEITANGSEGVTYSWSGPGGFTAATQSITATVAGNYIVTVTSENGCTAKDTAIVTQDNTLPTVTVAGGKLTCDVTSLEITANGSAGVTYSWSGPGGFTAATQSITATAAGDYIVTVTGANGCIAKDTATITQDTQLPTVTAAGGVLTCQVTSLPITANGSAGVTYSWSGPGGFTANTQSITATAAGDYIVTVTSANGCIAKDTATVTQDNTLPTVTVAGGELTCEVTSLPITANGSAGVTYSWSGPGGFTANTQSITATAAGNYIVTVTSANGCIAKDTATVTQNTQLPTVTVTGGKLTCAEPGLEITANGSAGVTYSWSGPGGFTANTQTITATAAGDYIVTVTSANGCIAKATAVVTLAGTPTLTATPSCVDNKGKVTLLASGGQAPYTYSKDGETFQAEAIFSGLANGNYIFTVKDANGCIFTVTAVVKCEVECIPQIYTFCENEAINVTIEAEEGLENYQWYRNGEVIAGATGWIYTATEPGRYHYTAGTGDQCDGILCCPIEITRYPGFVATAIAGNLDCANGPVVPVTLTVAGGSAPYTYSKDGVTFGSNPVFLVGPGTHKFYVKDGNGCINETNTVVVPEIEKPKTPIVTVDKTAICGNEKATLTAACESGDVIEWNNGMVGGLIQVGEGTYWAVCSNLCGSSPASAPVTISKKPGPKTPEVATDKTLVCGNELATLTAHCTVGDVIEWSNGMYGSPIQVGQGIYTARCKNECGISTDSRHITITTGKEPGSPEVGTDKSMVCGDEKATLVAHCEVGSFAVWSNGMIGSPIQVGEGIYTAICRNDCGDSEDSRHITINKGMVPPPPTLSPSKVFVCGEEKVTISALCETGSIIQWSNGMEGSPIQVGAGVYRAVCKNTCGTSSESIPVIISKDKDPAAPSVATDRTTVCGDEKAQLSALCESGIIIWSNGLVGSPIQVGTGTYTAKCSNDCGTSVASAPITITTGGVPGKPIITAEKTSVCGDEQVKLIAYCASGTVSWIGVSGFNNTVYVGTGIYAAKCTNACGTSVASDPVTITPGTTPTRPVITTTVTDVCGDEKATLTGTCPTGGDLVWSNGMTGSPIQVGIGFYTARCVNACGTSPASDMIAIETGRVPGRPTITANKTSVCGEEKALLTGTCPTGGTLTWSNGMSGSPILVGTGTYYATCVNACGTSPASTSITITTGLLPGKPLISADKLMVCGDDKATLSGVCPSGGTLSWSNGMAGNQIQVSAGTYYANCVNECGTSTASETIVIVPGTVPAKPTISTNKTTLCDGETATLSGSCISGNLVWSNGLTGNSIQVGAGTYTAVCINNCGSSPESNTITINKGPVPAQPLIQANKLTVCGTDKAMLTGTCPTGGTLTWSNGMTGSPILVGAGSYYATCVNACGTSTASTPVIIGNGVPPSAPVIISTNSFVCDNDKVSLTATCTNGTVKWSTGATTAVISVGAGTYTAVCENECGPSATSVPVVIEQKQKPVPPVIVPGSGSICANTTTTLTATCPAGSTVMWSNGMTGNTITVGPGTYSASCVNECGSSPIPTTVTIQSLPLPTAPTVVASKTTLCGAETATLTATCSAGTVLWSDGSTVNPRQVGAGTYTASCVTACGTSPASTPVVITTQPAPTAPQISANKQSVCGDEKASLTGTCPTGGTLTWSNGMTGSPILVGAGTYTATCVSACGTSPASTPVVIGTGSAPTAPTVVANKTTLCGAETATLTATCSAGTVLWSDGSTVNPRQVGAGTYTASCVTACGTSPASTPVVITTQPAPTAPQISANKQSVCGDEKASLTGTCPTGGTLTWSNGMTGSPILVGAGTYTATCVSACGTSPASTPVVIGTGSTPTAPTVVASKTTLCGAETATLTATCSAGTVLWSDGSTVNPRQVGAGTYTASCVTACGTSPASTPVVITTQPAPTAPQISANKQSVCGDEKASLTGTCPTGGTLTWSNGMTGSPILVGAGTYTATCVSACGTSPASTPVVIGTGSTPTAPTVVASKTTLCGAETATLTATCSAGTVLWSDGSTVNPRQVGAGTYTASCVTACGTSPASTPVVITTQPAPTAPQISANKQSVCGDEKASLTGTCPTGGTLTWSNGMTGSPILVGAGTYTATCVSACGTSPASTPVVIGTGSAPTAPIVVADKTALCDAETATITAACTTGTVLWSDGSTVNPRQVGAGTYTASCVTACGTSTASTPVVITKGNKPVAPTVTASVTTVCDSEKATLTANCTTGTVLWNDGSTANPRQAGAGTYTATCVNACGGSANSNTVVINRGPVPTKPSVQTNRNTVCGTEKATLTGSCPTGGTLTWSNGMTGSPILVGIGSYTATCVNTCGASEASAAIVIGDGSRPDAPVITTSKSVLCGTETAILTATGCTGGIIHWSNGGTGTTKVVSAGTYTATCVTSCGTSDNSAPVTITQESAPANFTISTSTAKVCGTEKATLTATGCEGGTVTWSTGATGTSIQVGVGSYSATCTSNCGGTVSAGPLVIGQENPAVSPSVSADKAAVCGTEKATLTASGCAGTITWYRPGVNGPALIGSGTTSIQVGAGTYTATCTTACGTSPASNPVTVGTSDKPAAPSVSADKATVCDNDKATLTATGCSGTVTWSTGATGISIQVGAGTYTATCTTDCGTSSYSLPVTIGTSARPAAPSVSTDKSTVCENEKATLTASGCSGTVTWSTGATGTSIQVGAGTYTATCTSGCGTSNNSTPVTIGTSAKPAAPSVSADKSTVCENEKATLTASGCAGTITWSTGQTVSVIQVGTGTYTATCTTSCGTSGASAPVTIGTSDKPAAPSVSADKATVCEGEKATLTASGCAGTITWSTGQTVSVIQVGTGTYTATCTTSCGTSNASAPVTIGTSDKPAAPSVSADKATVCEGEKATLTATGCAGTITWSTGATGVSIQVGAGSYTATCTTSCGTSDASASVTIGTSDKPAAPSVSADKTTVCGEEKATLTATGCAGTITWSTGATGASIQVGTGSYTATCTTSCGTSDASASVTIGTSDKPAAPSVSADKTTVCEEEKATLTAGGCAGTVTWSTGATGTSIQVGAGTYTATCTTSCGTSEISAPVTIGTSEKPAKPVITASGSSVCGTEQVTLTANGCSGTVTWSTGATGTSILVGAGTYYATCTTGCGTSDAAAVSISEGGSPEPPVVTADKGSVCGSEKATLTATGCVGGVITWSTGETGFQIQVGRGVYTATCTDACGNESIACIAVEIDDHATAPDTPVISASTDGVCGQELATLTANGCTGGTVIWSNGSEGHSIQVSAGTYTAICKTDCGESLASNSVVIHAKGGTLSVSSDKAVYCAGETVTLTASGCTNGTVRWSNGATGTSITLPATASMTMTAVCSTGGSSGSCDFAVGDVEFDYQAQQNPNGMNTRFLLTDNAYGILQVKNTPKFENVQEGSYKVITVVYIGNIPGLAAGANYSDLDKGDCYSDEETEISVCNAETPGNTCEAVGSVHVQVKTPAECGGDGGNEACETAPTVISSVGSATCLGTSVTLTAMNCNAQVVWNTGATGASINFVPTETGAYKFSAKCVSLSAGCESAVSQEITVNVVGALPKPAAIETLNNICPLVYVDLRNAILGEPTTGGTFEFRYGNSPSSALVTSAQVTAGVYYLFERNTAGCYSEGTPVTVVISGDCENPVHPTAVDVAISKTGDKETAEMNEEVTYTVTVSNVGENEATGIRVRDILPVGLAITQVSDNAFLEEGVVRISLDTLAPGESVEVTYTGTVVAPGRIANKAELEAVAENDTNTDNNSSIWVINHVAQVDSLIGLAKAVGTIALREDLGAQIYEVPFVFTVTNMGLKDLGHVSLKDTLSLTFGNAEVIESIHLEADPGLTVNPTYTGSGEHTDLLIAEESAIAAGTTLNVRMKVFVNLSNTSTVNFANSATVYAGADKELSDRSTDGVNADPDNDGDPTNNSTPTEFTIGEGTPTYGIGAALTVVDSAFVNNGTAYEVTYRVQVRNFGPDPISGVFLTDTLTQAFADAPEFTVTGAPVITSQGSTLVVNPDFNGKDDVRILLPDAEAILAPGQTDTVEFKVTVVFGTNVGPYSTNVIAFGEDNGTALTDTSNTGEAIIKHLSTPTVFSIPEENVDPRSLVEVPEGFSPNGDGVNDNWKIELKGNAKIEKLIIVNRYGSTLYEEDGETVTTLGWDGKANKGVIPGTGTVPTGTYYYKLKLVGQDKYIIDYITVER